MAVFEMVNVMTSTLSLIVIIEAIAGLFLILTRYVIITAICFSSLFETVYS